MSVYDRNEVYWTLRNRRYSILSTRVKNLLIRQRRKCSLCKDAFITDDLMEVYHIILKSKNGNYEHINLELLHRQCHIEKTKKDLQM